MNRLIETFLAEDITGNRYEIERYHVIKKRQSQTMYGVDFFLHKGTIVSHMGDDIYYIAALDTEVKKL